MTFTLPIFGTTDGVFHPLANAQPLAAIVHQKQSGKTVVELNRYAVGVGERVGVGPRLVSCERDSPVGSGCID